MTSSRPQTSTTATKMSTNKPSSVTIWFSKVPEITLVFWVVKILSTGMGEAASDWALRRGSGLPGLGLPGTIGLDAAIFVIALALQCWVRRYVVAVYWFAVVGVSIFGTVAADVVHFVVGVPLWLTSTLYAGALAVNFVLWHVSEKTLSIHSIHTRRRETFYWITVFLTFALGTAVGDLTAMVWNLGFLLSGIMFAALILVPAILYRVGLNGVVAFWSAYVVTRPLGASFADWFGATPDEGGLGLGFGNVALVMTIMIAAGVGYLARVQRRERRGSAQQL